MIHSKEFQFHLVPSMRISSKSMSSESYSASLPYSVLSEIVSSLSVYTLNRKRSKLVSKSKQEANHLMNFACSSSPEVIKHETSSSSVSSTSSSNSDFETTIPVSISPSLSFESHKIVLDSNDNPASSSQEHESFQDSICESSQKLISMREYDSAFSLSISDLSIENIWCSYSQVKDSPVCLSHPVRQLVTVKDHSLVSAAVAETFISSFDTAIQTRIQSWIKQLTKILASLYEKKVDTEKQAFIKGSINHKVLQSDLFDIRAQLKASSEARVINALAQISSIISVHDVQTSFSILEECPDINDDNSFPQEPTSKQMRCNDQMSITEERAIHRSHALLLTIKCTVIAAALKNFSFAIKAPGVIHGSFKLVGGEPHVKDVTIFFDTDALAKAMEKESRKIVRICAQETMIGQKFNHCTIHDTVYSQILQAEAFAVSSDDSDDECDQDNISKQHGVENESNQLNSPQLAVASNDSVTPRMELSKHDLVTLTPSNHVLVTPTIVGASSVTSFLSNTMPPPPPRLTFDETSSKRTSIFLHPRRISPSADSNPSIATYSSTSVSPKRKEHYSTSKLSELFPTISQKNTLPSLVSPYKEPVHGGDPRVLNNRIDVPTLPVLGGSNTPIQNEFLKFGF